MLKLEDGDTPDPNGSSSSGNGTDEFSGSSSSGITPLGEHDLISSDDITDFLQHGEISSELMASASGGGAAQSGLGQGAGQGSSSDTLKRKLQQYESASSSQSNGSSGSTESSSTESRSMPVPSSSSNSNSNSVTVEVMEDPPTDPSTVLEEAQAQAELPAPGGRLQKLVSFDSLASNIRPQLSRPPLSSPGGSAKANGGGTTGVQGAGAGAGAGMGGGVLSRQHSLELPPPGQSISGGYHYAPLSSAPGAHSHYPVKNQTSDAGAGGEFLHGQQLLCHYVMPCYATHVCMLYTSAGCWVRSVAVAVAVSFSAHLHVVFKW